jgi:basic membrane protein A
MRKLLIVLGVLFAVHIALLFAGRSGVASAERAGATNVGIVFDVGGRGDKSFNDGAYAGADSAT